MREEVSLPTRKQMQGFITGGRIAIEYALLLVLIRPRTFTEEDEAELVELKALLELYGKVMAQYELPNISATPTNNEKGAKN